MDDKETQPVATSTSGREVLKGFILAVGLQVISVVGGLLFVALQRGDQLTFLVGVCASLGLYQLVLIGPVMFWAHRKGKIGIKKGLIIAASLVFLLNAGCDLVLLRP